MINKTLSLVFGLAFSLIGVQVHAGFIDVGVVPVPAVAGAEVTSFNFTPDDAERGGPVEDVFTFTLEEDAVLMFALEDISSPPEAGIRNVQFRVHEGEVIYTEEPSGPPLPNFPGDRLFELSDFESDRVALQSDSFSLSAGVYSGLILADLTGVAGGNSSAEYTISLTVAGGASPVPVPTAGLLFFSGIAALGFGRLKRARS